MEYRFSILRHGFGVWSIFIHLWRGWFCSTTFGEKISPIDNRLLRPRFWIAGGFNQLASRVKAGR
jgi:hypothetical protein